MSDTRNVISWDGYCKIYWGNLNLNFKEWIEINSKKNPCAFSFDRGAKIRGEMFYRFINWSFTFSHPRLSCPVQTWWCSTIFKTFLSIVQPLGRLWTWPWPWPWQSTKIMVKEMTQQFENMKPNDHRWRLFMQNRSQLSILAPDQSLRKETQARPMAILLCIPSLSITGLHSISTCCPVYLWTLPTFKFPYKKKQSKLKSSQKQENNKIETWWLGGVPRQPHLWCYFIYSKLTPSRSWKSKFLQLLRCLLLLDFLVVFSWFLCSKKEILLDSFVAKF